MNATDTLLNEACDRLDEARRERDSARQEVADLREALRLTQMTPQLLLERIALGGLSDADRLMVMAQSPADNHHWSKPVGKFTAGEVRASLGHGQ